MSQPEYRTPKTPTSRAALQALVESGATAETDPNLPPADVPLTTPERQVFLRVTRNEVHDDKRGGAVVLQGLGGRHEKKMIGAYLTLVFDDDTPMWDFPSLRADMQGSVFELVLREATLDEVPPNPDKQPAVMADERIRALEAENASLRRQLEGGITVRSLAPSGDTPTDPATPPATNSPT